MQPTDDQLERRRRLILLAEQVARAPLPVQGPPVGLVAGLAAIGVVSIGAGVKFAVGSGPDRAAAVAATSVVPTAAPGSSLVTTTAPEVVALAPLPPTSTPPGVDVALPGQPERWAVMADGVLHLRGRVPDLATAQESYSAAADRVGTAAVVVEFSIVPGAAPPNEQPVHVPEIARFQPGSTALLPGSIEAIRSLVTLAAARDSLVVTVHPDRLGDDAALDAARTDALRQLLIGLGVAPAKVSVDLPFEYGPPLVEDVPDALSLTLQGWFG
jgi:outer membrane protein OmpA-like peptidoglycan-associated protein